MSVLNPRPVAMYPEGFQTTVTVPALARRWEGAARPHHFAGVATVVTKLFGMVRPHLALFGQKDYQQAALVRQLVNDLNLGVAIRVRPTVRERDGLAMSSRNVYLSPDERRIAPLLFQALRAGRLMVESGNERRGCDRADHAADHRAGTHHSCRVPGRLRSGQSGASVRRRGSCGALGRSPDRVDPLDR